MGADLIAMGVTVDPNKASERERAKYWINLLSDDQINTVIDHADADPFGDMLDDLTEARDFIVAGILEINGWADGDRYTIDFAIDGSERVFYVAGGTSWGDSPFDAWDQVNAVLNLPDEILYALGIFPGVQP
jgi:hypothetical protein